MKSTPRKLRAEFLEDRSVPAIFGVPWANPGDLTLSFVPDGTALTGGGTSNLFATMEATMPRAVWQGEILRAFQAWTSQANVNVRIVSDSGPALGTPGAVQGDTRFGDIRIAGANLSKDAIGSGTPFSWTGTTLAGDFLLNNSYKFVPGGTGSGTFDLFTVALQEAGHIFGVDNSAETTSVMYTTYSGPRSGLSASDVADIQELYGARTLDFASQSGAGSASSIVPVVDNHSNDTRNNATQVKARDQVDARFDVVYNGKLSDATDVDYYRIKVPRAARSLDTINVAVMVWGLDRNGLNPAVHLYDGNGNPIAFRILSNDAGVVSVQSANMPADSWVYVAVDARDDGDAAHNTGGYQLAVDFGTKPVVLFDDIVTAKLNNTKTSETGALTVKRGALMTFSLAARTVDGTAADVAMTVTDADGNIVFTLTAKSGKANMTRVVYMAAGSYSVKYSATGAGLAGGVTYNLQGHILSDNVGPYSTTQSGADAGLGYNYTGNGTTQSWSNQYWF